MANGKGTALVIAALVVGAAGMGVGAFSVIRYEVVDGPQGPQGDPGLDGINGTDGIDGVNGTLNNIVAIWQNLTGVGAPASSYYIGLEEIIVNKSEFFTLTVSNTNVTLIKAGWYKFNIMFLWRDLIGTHYNIDIEQNGAVYKRLYSIYSPPSLYAVNAYVYVFSDGDDSFRFRCFSGGPSFNIYTSTQLHNQVVLEYVGEPI